MDSRLFIVLFCFLLFKSSYQKSCHQLYSDKECTDDNKGYIKCEFNYKTYKHNRTEVACPTGEMCKCFIGDDCKLEDMCGKPDIPLPFVDTGVLTWTKKDEKHWSQGDSQMVINKGFAYKLPNGRMYSEDFKTSWGSMHQRIYIPKKDGKGFIKYSSWNSNGCEKTEADSAPRLVGRTLNGGRLESEQGNQQRWAWRNNDLGAATERKWNFYVKQYKGKLVPLSYRHTEVVDVMWDGSSHYQNDAYSYYPMPSENIIKEIEKRERRIIKTCMIQE